MSANDVPKLLNAPAFEPTRVRRTPSGDVPQLIGQRREFWILGRADPGTPYTDYRAPAGAVLFQRDNGSVVELLRFNLYAVNSPQLAAIVRPIRSDTPLLAAGFFTCDSRRCPL